MEVIALGVSRGDRCEYFMETYKDVSEEVLNPWSGGTE